MNNKEFDKRIYKRIKNIDNKSHLLNLLLLLLPIILTIGIFIASLYSYGIPLVLLYFVLPMYYSVEKSMRNKLSGIGDGSVSYAQGYKDFFGAAQGGVFGLFSALIKTLILIFAFYLIFSTLLPYIANAFGFGGVYTELYNLVQQRATSAELVNFMIEKGYLLTSSLSVLISVIFFIPQFLFLFFFVSGSLIDHFQCTIVLPDIDKNISASQARAMTRGIFKRLNFNIRFIKALKYNWYLYIMFALLYALVSYFVTKIVVTNVTLIPLVIVIVPASSLLYGIILDYFALMNSYAILEESQDYLLAKLPLQIQATLYQTFNNPEYIHAEESLVRGSFVPNNGFANATFNADEVEKEEDISKESAPVDKNMGGIIDFSKKDDEE